MELTTKLKGLIEQYELREQVQSQHVLCFIHLLSSNLCIDTYVIKSVIYCFFYSVVGLLQI